MKKVVSVIAVAVMIVLCFTLSACGNKYSSKYSATLLVQTNLSTEGSVSFGSFKGTNVIKFKKRGSEEVYITYVASLGEGKINVYYDYNDEKLNLFDISTNGNLEGRTETFSGDKTVYIIIESDGKCEDGRFEFALVKAEK